MDSERGIQCDGECDRWFHVTCSGLTDTEYSALSGNTREKWHCNRADCKCVDENPILKLSDQMGELLKSVSQLASKAELKDLNESISSLKLSIDTRLENMDLRLTQLEEKVNKIDSSGSTSAVGFEDIVQEIGDRSRRVCNIIVYNLSESSSKDVKKRIDNEKSLLKEIGQAIDYNFDFDTVKLLRIGKPNKDGIRPLKLVFHTLAEVKIFINKFTTANLKVSNGKFSDVSVSRDKTYRERQYLKNLREELEIRTKNGERNLTIKYRNGVPVIEASKNG